MISKINQYCVGIIEACWIAVILVTPIFFNILSSRIFEPDKIAILRSIALVMLAAWLVKLVDQGRLDVRNAWRSIRSVPLLLPVFFLALIYILSTVVSINPRISLLGSYPRLQGSYTFFSYLVIFISILANLRTKEQLQRLFTTILLASFPIALYGILQRYGLDPIPWGGNVQNRISANMGNSIFLAAYLIMVIPVAIAKIVLVFQRILREDVYILENITRATLYIFILLLDLIAIYLSGSRGPVLGLLTGVFFLLILLSIMWQKRILLATTLITAGLAGIGLLFLNIPNGPLSELRDAPWLGRFGKLVDMEQRTSQVRSLIWQGASQLVSFHSPLEYPDGSRDSLNFIRPVVGYGPESMYVAYNRFFPPELAQIEKRNASPDRSHNESWDAIVTTGFTGFLIYQFLFIATFYYGLAWLGLIKTRNKKILYFWLVVFGGILCGILFSLWLGIGFLGVGIPFGLILGVVSFVTIVSITEKSLWQNQHTLTPELLWLIVAMAAISAHYVEIHFGIAIVSTRNLFWIFLGILVVLGSRFGEFAHQSPENKAKTLEEKPIPIEKTGKDHHLRLMQGIKPAQNRIQVWRTVLVTSFITSLVLGTLGYNFISNPQRGELIFQILKASFTELTGSSQQTSYGIAGIIFLTLIVFTIILSLEAISQISSKQSWLAAGASIAISLTISAGFWIWQASRFAQIVSIEARTAAEVQRQVGNYTNLVTWYYLFVLILILAMGRIFPAEWPSRPVYNRTASVWFGVVSGIFVLLIAFFTNLRVIHADITFKLADSFVSGQQWPGAIFIYQEALKRSPLEDHYYLFLGRAYLEYARTLESEAERDQVMQQAEQDLKTAQNLNPLNTDHTANLARLYSWRSSVNSTSKMDDLTLARDSYQKALALSPNNASLWVEYAILNLNGLNQPEEARRSAERASDLDNLYDRAYAVLGDYYIEMASQTDASTEKANFLSAAIDQYAEAINYLPVIPANYPTLYSYYAALGNVYYDVMKYQESATAYEAAYQYSSDNNRWRVAETLAQIYYELRNSPKALAWVQVALQDAPDSAQERINLLLSEIETLP